MKDFGKRFSAMSPIQQLIVAAVIFIILVIVFKFAKGMYQKFATNAELSGEALQLQAAGMKKSYTDSMYTSMAQQLYYAMDGLGTYEDTIIGVFNKMNNELDVLELEKKFGIRDGYSLSEWLHGDLSEYWMNQINSILASKGINRSY